MFKFKQLIHQSFMVILLTEKQPVRHDNFKTAMPLFNVSYSLFIGDPSCEQFFPIKAESHSFAFLFRTVWQGQLHRERFASRGLSRFAF